MLLFTSHDTIAYTFFQIKAVVINDNLELVAEDLVQVWMTLVLNSVCVFENMTFMPIFGFFIDCED